MKNKVIAIAIALILFLVLGSWYYELQQVKMQIHQTNQLFEKTEQLQEDVNELKSEIDGIESEMPTFAGTFETTAYCKCEECCGKWSDSPTKTGTVPQEGRTVAVDPKVIPLGTEIIIDGQTYIAEDTGSAVKGKMIDIYLEDHNETEKYGRQESEVWIYT